MAMDSRSRRLCAPLVLLLLRLPTSTIAELTASIRPPSPVLELRQTTPTDNEPLSTSTNPLNDQGGGSQDDDDPSDHVFNYYFLLIAIFVAILLLGFVFAGRRRKRKTMRLLNTRQEALRRDIEAWPGGPRPTRNNTPGRWTTGTRNWRGQRNDVVGVTRLDEGLDDLGEAPPPYNPGDKPPSIAVGGGVSHVSEREVGDEDGGIAVPLRTMSRSSAAHNPPGYMESVSNNGSDEHESASMIARPDAAVTPTGDGFGNSTRRLLDRTDGS